MGTSGISKKSKKTVAPLSDASFVDEVEKKLAEASRRHANAVQSSQKSSKQSLRDEVSETDENHTRQDANDTATSSWWAPLDDELKPSKNEKAIAESASDNDGIQDSAKST